MSCYSKSIVFGSLFKVSVSTWSEPYIWEVKLREFAVLCVELRAISFNNFSLSASLFAILRYLVYSTIVLIDISVWSPFEILVE
jgi:hypothetical protein